MKILVVGGAGYIGSVCSEFLINEGHEVGIFDNLVEGHRSAVDPRATFFEGDLVDGAGIKNALSKHRAGRGDAFRRQRVGRRIDAQSGEIFSQQRRQRAQPARCDGGGRNQESDLFLHLRHCSVRPSGCRSTKRVPQRPINPYGESKLMFESVLRWYHAIHGLKFVSLRYFNAAGASANFGEDHRIETHLIPNVLKVALGTKPHVEIYGTDYDTPDGTCIRDYIHILDLARAHILALDAPKSEFYNLGTGGGSSVREVIEAGRKITGREIPVVEKPRRPGDPPRLIASSEKIKKELGWDPQFQSLDAIIESAWKWHQKFPNGYPD